MPFFAAHVAMGAETCGSVIEKRTMYGERSVTTEEAAFITTMGVFAAVSVTSLGAAANWQLEVSSRSVWKSSFVIPISTL